MTLSLVSIVCFAFVTQTWYPQENSTARQENKETCEEFQTALDRWSRSLIASGGALRPVKSFCYLIDFHWTGTDFVYCSKDDMPGSFTLVDKHSNREILTRLEVWEAQKTLGVFLAMDGNQRAQFLFLREKSKEFANQIRSSKCDKNTALYTYNSCFMKSMEYCMTTTRNPRPYPNALTQLTNKLARAQYPCQNVRYITVSLKNSNYSVETKRKEKETAPLHYYASVSSLTTKAKRPPETSPNLFRNHDPFQNHGVYCRTIPVKPAGNKRQQPAPTAYHGNSPKSVYCNNIMAKRKHHTVTKFTFAKSKSNRNLNPFLH
jgi:hypothetical protein